MKQKGRRRRRGEYNEFTEVIINIAYRYKEG